MGIAGGVLTGKKRKLAAESSEMVSSAHSLSTNAPLPISQCSLLAGELYNNLLPIS